MLFTTLPQMCSDPTCEDVADYCELLSLRGNGRGVTKGLAEISLKNDGYSNEVQGRVVKAWDILSTRSRYSGWPLNLSRSGVLSPRQNSRELTYTYLCFSYAGSSDLTQKDRDVFDDLCLIAMKKIGCKTSKKIPLKDTSVALQEYAAETGTNYHSPLLPGDKDITVDFLGWSGFGDGRSGDLISPKMHFVGQFASGHDWKRKVKSEPSLDLMSNHLRFKFDPLLFISTPAFVEDAMLRSRSRHKKLIIDRPRLIELLPRDRHLPAGIKRRMRDVMS